MEDKIVHIVGNRPQFVKLAPLSRELHKRGYQDIIIHTGQHYDTYMSDVFFEELKIQKPYKNLAIGSGTHAEMTAKAMIAIEKVICELHPKVVILYGDTDSTVAAALAVKKVDVPIVHIEAGLRTRKRNNPEENNRIVTDHLSDILCCPDKQSLVNLQHEGLEGNSFFTGDVMYDTFLEACKYVNCDILIKNNIFNKKYILMTWHRQENTSDKKKMEQILEFISAVSNTVICPMHPRTKKKLEEFELLDKATSIPNFNIVNPVGYLEMVTLLQHASYVITDSGGLSKESFFANVKCLFMLDLDVWTDLVKNGWIKKVDMGNKESVKDGIKYLNMIDERNFYNKNHYYGNGDAAGQIVDLLEKKGCI